MFSAGVSSSLDDVSNCTYCSFRCSDKQTFIRHFFEAHCFKEDFSYECVISSCSHVFTTGATYASFSTHCNRKHSNWREVLKASSDHHHRNTSILHESLVLETSINQPHSDQDDSSADNILSEVEMSNSESHVNNQQSVEQVAALFLLTLKEKYRLTQASLDFALGSLTNIVNMTVRNIKESVQSQLVEISENNDLSLRSCFPEKDLFSNLKTEYQQTKYYKENFGLVEPISVLLGTSLKYQQSGSTRRLVEHQDTFQYVPLTENLEKFLSNPEVLAEVMKSHARSDNFLEDFCDGSFFKSHPLFANHSEREFCLKLQFIIYFDEVEVTNPLGSTKGKHKLALFYYTLANIHPKLRATLKTIQLIAAVTSPNLKEYGYEPVLKPFIDEVNVLAEGCYLQVNGKCILVKGAVLVMLADTLAAHSIGGFKVGIGFALRQCRNCLATKEMLSTKFLESEFVLRTPATYDYHCLLLNGPLAETDSVTYGINYCSALNRLAHFHVANHQLPQDVMHVLLEGAVPYTMRLMLQVFILEKSYFTLYHLNERIAYFKFSHIESRDKPCPLPEKILQPCSSLNQSAAQMWNLAVYLPLMIGDQIPNDDKHWECFLLLLDILQLCMSRIQARDLVSYLRCMIQLYLCTFQECYPSASIIPKQHYMVHLPSQILKLGPLVNTWCMRMEAKNSYFKRISQLGNFKNIALTVANRHQKLMCSLLNNKDFFEKFISSSSSSEMPTPLHQEPPFIQEVILSHLETQDDQVIHRFEWIECRGSKYRHGDFVLCGFQDDDAPLFGRIYDIIVANNEKVFFCCHLYFTDGTDYHYHSYVLLPTEQNKIIPLCENDTQLGLLHPLQSHELITEPGRLYIVTKSIVFKV